MASDITDGEQGCFIVGAVGGLILGVALTNLFLGGNGVSRHLLQIQAVKAGVARWVPDNTGATTFEFIPPAEKKNEAAEAPKEP